MYYVCTHFFMQSGTYPPCKHNRNALETSHLGACLIDGRPREVLINTNQNKYMFANVLQKYY